jgi:hypothetical protein
MNSTQFKASNTCMNYEQLLHYTSFEVLKIILNSQTLKCNNLKNLNDRLEPNRKGIENYAGAFYVSCFSHNQNETVPFWYMYGGTSPNNRKVLLRFKNFAYVFVVNVNKNLGQLPE